MKIKYLKILLFGLLATFFASQVFAANASVYVVDVERVLTRSRAAQAGQAHIKEARKTLEDGFEKLRQLYDKQPEDIRQRVLSDGANALSRQLSLEQQSVNSVITTMMLDAIKAWRKANKADIVVARQNLLDASDDVDITAAIIQAMDAASPKFADLPVISINPPEQTSQSVAPAAPEPAKGKK